MGDVINIPVSSFTAEGVIDALNTQLADAYASFLQTDNPTYGNRYYSLLRALHSLERFWDGE